MSTIFYVSLPSYDELAEMFGQLPWVKSAQVVRYIDQDEANADIEVCYIEITLSKGETCRVEDSLSSLVVYDLPKEYESPMEEFLKRFGLKMK